MLLARIDEPLALPPDARVALLGGKGDGLMRMAAELGLPVPPGFVLTTRACERYLDRGWTEELEAALRAGMAALEATTGRSFGRAGTSGDAAMPLLVSVRSGAPVSMPGMLDTLLNVGLDARAEAALERIDPAFVARCRERLVAGFASSVGGPPPGDPFEQLRQAVEAVFRSVRSARAAAYRRHEGLADELVTAVNVQAMVFGNLDARSATGVYFTRDPATGEARPYGDVLFRAQGEDVVSGRFATEPLAALERALPDVARELYAVGARLERAYRDLVEIEFTVERGRLWLLQVRVGKRSPRAALRIATELALDPDFPLDRRQAVLRVRDRLARLRLEAATSDAIGTPRTSETGTPDAPGASEVGTPDAPGASETGEPGASDAGAPLACGLGASPGIASGEIVTTIEGALAAATTGRSVILVRPETSPEDVEGMAVAAGLLTSRGGLASHAAVVARGWGIPAVVGLAGLVIERDAIEVAGRRLAVGERISIDGASGAVHLGVVAAERSEAPELEILLGWARELGIALDGEAAPTTSPQPTRTTPAGSPVEASRPDGDAGDAPNDALLHALALKGAATTDALAAAIDADPKTLPARLEALVAEGLVVAAKPIGFRSTESGRTRAEAGLERDRAALGPESARAALLAFQPFDPRMKQAVTDWQLRPEGAELVPNDHADAGWDADVLARLGAIVEEATAWLDVVADRLPRLHCYSRRLRRGLDAVRSGDARFVASPRVDSVHGVWFELHEDLIRLAGSTRAAESAAGRAS